MFSGCLAGRPYPRDTRETQLSPSILTLRIPVMCKAHASLRGMLSHELPSRTLLASIAWVFTLFLSKTQPLQLNLTINTGYKRLNKITIKFGTELKPTKPIVVNYNFTNSTLQSPRLAVLWQNSKIDFRLKMWVKNSYQNSFTPNSRNCEGLEPNGQVFLKTITQDDHCKQKSWNTYGTSTMWSSNNNYTNKAWLDQTWTITINSDHNDHSHKEWTSGHASK